MQGRWRSFCAILVIGVVTTTGSRAQAYNNLIPAVELQDSPYDVKVFTDNFQSTFALDPLESEVLARSAFYAWEGLGLALPDSAFHQNSYSGDYDLSIDANTCCDWDCLSGCLGRAYPQGLYNSDDCYLTVYRRTDDDSYSDDRIAADGSLAWYDIQSITTHELGHCLGLGHPSDSQNTESLMYQGYYSPGTLHKRFPRDDDRDGARYEQGTAAWTIALRNVWGGSYPQSILNVTAGSPGLASATISGVDWDLLAYINSADDSKIVLRSLRGLTVGPECTISSELTYDGVSVARDTNGFAVAYRANDDSGRIFLIRNWMPSLSTCATPTVEIVPYIQTLTTPPVTRRRPSIAYDPGSGRLVLVFLDASDGRLHTRTYSSVSGWSTEQTVTTEWTDAPVGLACDYWNPSAGYRCFLAFPTSDGYHTARLCRTRIDNGSVVFESCWNENSSWFANVGPAIRIEQNNRLRIFYTGADDGRNMYYLYKNYSGSKVVTSGGLAGGASRVAPAMSQRLEAIARPY